jgi:hypothetical protein
MDPIFDLMLVKQQKQEVVRVLECNKATEKHRLVLSQEEANNLVCACKNSLGENGRIEFGEGILPKIIYQFCDSQFINQDNYTDTLTRLQEIFYLYKNEAQDELTDDELLDFMKKQYEEICFGDLDYLENTCLERYARSVRSGHYSQMQSRLRDEYTLRDVENNYNKLSEETRWDYDVYKMKLDEMF